MPKRTSRSPARAQRTSRLRWTDRLAIAVVTLLLGVFVALPLVSVAFEALSRGFPAVLSTFADPNAVSAIVLTACVALITIALNGAFGVLAAWTLAKYSFPGKTLVLAIIDLPLTVRRSLRVLRCCCVSERVRRSAAGSWRTE